MKHHAKNAFNKLKRLGCPVFERDDVEYFIISAEYNSKEVWADYYMEYSIHKDAPVPGVHPKITEILEEFNLFAEWETPGGLIVYDL